MSADSREILLVRHPQTEANEQGRYLGRGDSPLTARGRAQTDHIVEVVRAFRPEAVFTSPLGRTMITARAIIPAGSEPIVLDDLAEIDFGEVEGLTWDEIDAAGIRFDHDSGGPIAPGGESGAAFDERVRRAAAAIESGPMCSVAVTHGGVLRRLLMVWLGISLDAAWRIAVPNAVVATVRVADGAGVLHSLLPPPQDDRA